MCVPSKMPLTSTEVCSVSTQLNGTHLNEMHFNWLTLVYLAVCGSAVTLLEPPASASSTPADAGPMSQLLASILTLLNVWGQGTSVAA